MLITSRHGSQPPGITVNMCTSARALGGLVRSIIAASLLAWAAAVGAAGAQGLVKNGGFAIDAKLDGWQAGHAGFAFADDDGFQAPGSIRLKGPAPARAEGPSQVVALQPNTEYVLSAALKSDGRLLPSVRLRMADARDVVVAGPVRDTRWARVLVRFNSGANEKLILVCGIASIFLSNVSASLT